MSDLIDRQAAIDALTEYGNGRAVYIAVEEAVRRIEQLPPAQPVIVPCDYAKTCNEVSMNRIASAVVYMEILEDFKKYGYVLVDMSENMPLDNNSEIPNSSDTISRAKAIDGKICIRRSNGVEIYDDYVVPVEYLKQLPSTQPEIVTCDRCVATKLGECIWHNAGATYCSLGEVEK